MEKALFLLVTSILLVSLMGFVSPYGVASPYWVGSPLKIAPGDTKTVSITLQNVGTEDVVVDVFLKEGSEIANIREGEYTVPAGTIDTEILVTVTVPEGVPLEKLYKVTISSSENVLGEGGGVTLRTAFDTTFDVLISDISKTEKEGTNPIIVILVLVLVVLVLIFFFKKKKRKKRK